MLMPMLMLMLTTTNAGMNAQNVVLLESSESLAAVNDRLVEKFFLLSLFPPLPAGAAFPA
jgi:hypothetical protein